MVIAFESPASFLFFVIVQNREFQKTLLIQMALSFGRRLFCRVLSGENDSTSSPMEDRTHFAVEVDIPAQAVEKLAGTAKKNQLKKETGANMHLYTPKMNGELPYVRLWGSADQVCDSFAQNG